MWRAGCSTRQVQDARGSAAQANSGLKLATKPAIQPSATRSPPSSETRPGPARGRRRHRSIRRRGPRRRPCLRQTQAPASACSLAAQEGLEAAAAEVEAFGGTAIRGPDRRRRPRPGRGRRRGGRGTLRPDRRVGERRDGDHLRALCRDHRRGVHPRHPGHLPRHGLRHDGRAQADGAAKPRRGRPGRLRALPIARSRCSRPTAAASSRSAASPTRCAPSCSTTTAASGYRWCSFQRVNTPQFNWCRSKLPDHPQPVPPIYQPEVPAEAVYWAAHHRRREITVGGSAVKAIVGNKLAPRFADWYLARTGYASQQIAGMPIDPDRPDNLFDPVPSTGRDTRHVRRPGASRAATSCGRPRTGP